MRFDEGLPQLADDILFITDGGLETSLIFDQGIELPDFAAFALLRDEAGRAALRRYFEPYLALARAREVGIVLDTPTWRASSDWGQRLGYSADALSEINRDAVRFLAGLREEAAHPQPIVVAGVIGPRGDGYVVGERMSAQQAAEYPLPQLQAFADADADMATAMTMTYAEEASGFVTAASEVDLPAAVSFTLETDGRLPSGQPLREAIEQVDAETGAAAAYFLVNCAHPTHFADVLDDDGAWRERLRGIRANASRLSHAEIDAMETLDEGDPADLAEQYRTLRERLPHLSVVGGCCGTNDRHVTAISAALLD